MVVALIHISICLSVNSLAFHLDRTIRGRNAVLSSRSVESGDVGNSNKGVR